jgi:DNA-directed RNA polymerase subunit alpha
VQVSQPNDEKARLLARDAQASLTMVLAADGTTASVVPSHIFEVSIFDFELSVRARNCLKRLNLKTLGDLTRVTEDQLLNNKNFGETSLDEVKKILDAKSLRLGQSLEAGGEGGSYRPPLELTEAEQIKLAAPTSDLQLSVRARKCMNRLALGSIGELVSKSADELLEARNFGITSLNEVREKLRERGLALRGE